MQRGAWELPLIKPYVPQAVGTALVRIPDGTGERLPQGSVAACSAVFQRGGQIGRADFVRFSQPWHLYTSGEIARVEML